MALGSRKREEAFAAMLDDLAVSRAAQAQGEGGADPDALMGDIVSRLEALPAPAGGMPAEARAKLMAIAATELPAQAAERRAAAASAAAANPTAVTAAPRPAAPAQRPSPRPRPVPSARPSKQDRPRLRITDRFSLPAWTPIATGAVAAVVAVTGIGYAVSRSLPDSWLHDKNTTSTIQLNGAQTNAAINKLNAARAELNSLATAAYNDAKAHNGTQSTTGAESASSALTQWARTSAAGTTPLLKSARAGDASARALLLKYTDDEVRTLSSALPNLSPSVKAQAQQQITKLQAINSQLGAPPAASR